MGPQAVVRHGCNGRALTRDPQQRRESEGRPGERGRRERAGETAALPCRICPLGGIPVTMPPTKRFERQKVISL